MIKKVVNIFLFMFVSTLIYSQKDNFFGNSLITNYPPDITLSEPQNWAIVQDRRGIVYFGNGPEAGVLEFDGTNWRIINISNHSTARSLAIDSTGSIYVGAAGEFGYLAADSIGLLQYVSLTNLIPEKEKDFNNVLKIQTTKYGIYFITTNKIFRYFNDSINVIHGNFSQRYGFNINNILFAGNDDEGLFYFNGNVKEKLPYTKNIIQNCGRYVIMKYKQNKLLIATVNNGLFTYDLNMISYKSKLFKNNTVKNTSSVILKEIKSEISNYLKENSLYTCAKIDDNNYAFGTLQGGVIIMNAEGKIIKVINKNRGLLNNTILSLYADKAKNLWIGTYNGIAYVETGSPLSVFNELNGLYGTTISIIKHKNRRYIGTTQGIFYLPPYKLQMVDDNHSLNPVSNFDIECWNMISFGNYLLATGSDGVYSIDNLVAKRMYETNEIYCFGLSKEFPNYLFLGLTDGFALLQSTKNSAGLKFNKYKKFDEIGSKIRKIVSDNSNNLWLTTEYNGIYKVSFKNNNINNYNIVHFDTTNGLPQLNYNWVNKIDNKIIIGSRQGFYKPVYKKFGSDSIVEKFVPDSSFGKLFYSNNSQIENIFKLSKSKTIILDKNRGVGILERKANNNFWRDNIFNKVKNASQIFFDSDSMLWISTLNQGLYTFNQNNKKDYNTKYHTLIRKIVINKDFLVFAGAFYNDSSRVNNLYTTIISNQPEENIPIYSYEYNTIKFFFSSTFFEQPENIKFSWILEGYEKEWMEWSNKTEEKYKQLPDGDYIFKVKAKNVFNTESSIAEYKFTVLPPWQRTIWAYIGYIIIGIFFIYIIVRLNSRRLKAANIKLEKIITERTKEIRKQKDEILEQKQAITDSIQYAKRIQNAVLPPEEYINNVLPEHFILFKPRDIVSGDFYWLKQINEYVVFTAADCTGHGVPGAFMSMLGVALLNEIVRREEITKASQILDELRNQIKAALRQSGKEGEAKDGMDIALCVYNTKNNKVQFAGAYNPLYIIRNKELIEIKGDKMPIGIHLKTKPFTNNEVQLQKGDILYIFSDGFVDQFGGNQGRKFMVKHFKRLLIEISDRSLNEQKEILDLTITEWRGDLEQIDDIVVFSIKV